jgi:hypothetical protein
MRWDCECKMQNVKCKVLLFSVLLQVKDLFNPASAGLRNRAEKTKRLSLCFSALLLCASLRYNFYTVELLLLIHLYRFQMENVKSLLFPKLLKVKDFFNPASVGLRNRAEKRKRLCLDFSALLLCASLRYNFYTVELPK